MYVDFKYFKRTNSLSIRYEIVIVSEIEKVMGKSVLPVPACNDSNLRVQLQCNDNIPLYITYNTQHQTMTIKYGILLLKRVEEWVPTSTGTLVSVRSECNRNKRKRENREKVKDIRLKKKQKLNRDKINAFWMIGIGKKSIMFELDELPEKRIPQPKKNFFDDDNVKDDGNVEDD